MSIRARLIRLRRERDRDELKLVAPWQEGPGVTVTGCTLVRTLLDQVDVYDANEHVVRSSRDRVDIYEFARTTRMPPLT